MDISPDGWDIDRFDDVDWVPWGSGGNARAKLLAVAGSTHADFGTDTGATYLSNFKS